MEAVKAPIGFVYGNCVFADALDDGWAAFAVQTESYQWLGEDGKRARFLALLGALEAIEADVQILRVGRRWDLERYIRELETGVEADVDVDVEEWARRMPIGRRAGMGCRRAGMKCIQTTATRARDAHTRATRTACIFRRASPSPEGHRPGAPGGVSDREPARARARRRRVRLARRRAPSARVVAGDRTRPVGLRPARDEGLRARARAGQGRPGTRAPGRLPAGPTGARGRAAVAGATCLLPRAWRARPRRLARAAGARVRAQRGGHAGAAGGRRAALDGRLRRAPRPGAAESSPRPARAGRRSSWWGRCPSRRSSREPAWS